MHLTLRAATPADTRSIGAAMAQILRPGDAIALTGDLGAGKTTFAQGVARGFGFAGAVVSPTFTLVREYRTDGVTLLHADVYRLDRIQEVVDLELQEMLDEGCILLLEWGDAVEGILPTDHLVVELTVPEDSEERSVAVLAVGNGWAARWERLEQVLEPWRADA